MDDKIIVVCGATGNQGEAVIQSLVEAQKWKVVGLSRNPAGARAEALKKRGVEVMQADLQDQLSLARVFEKAHGVFGVTQPWSADYKKCNAAAEVEQGRNIIDACRQTGVRHLVLSTVFHFDRARTGVSHIDSKLEVEEYALETGLPCTLIEPASFMDNVGANYFPVRKGRIRGFVDADARVPYIACKDIGVAAVLAFDQPEVYIGREIGLIGDFVSGDELCLILSKLRGGERFKYSAIPRLLMRIFAKEFYGMRVAFEEWGRPPYNQGILEALNNCRSMYPRITTMEQHLRSRGYDAKAL